MDREKSAGCIFSLASWGAIFAGVVVILVVQLMLSLLGMAFGLWIIDPVQGAPMDALSIGAAIWWVVSSIIAVFLGGWVSGRMAAGALTMNAMLHGVITWGVGTLLTVYLLTAGIGALTAGAMSILTGSLQAVGGTVGAIVPGMGGLIPPELEREINQIIGQRQQASPGATAPGTQAQTSPDEVRRTIMSILQRGPQGIDRNDRETLTNVIAQHTGMSRQEARSTVNRLITQMEQLQQGAGKATQQAQRVAGEAAQGLGTAAFWSFIMLLLTAIAAAAGGASGGKSRNI